MRQALRERTQACPGSSFPWAGGSLLPPSVELPTSAPSAVLRDSELCHKESCPVNYCYNQGHCYLSHPRGCQPVCTCPPAFTDTRCFLAGNNFTPAANPGTTSCPCHPNLHTSLAWGKMVGTGVGGRWGQG